MTLYCLSVHQVKTATIAQAQIGTVCEKSAGNAFPNKHKINLFIITEYHSAVKINVGSKVSGVAQLQSRLSYPVVGQRKTNTCSVRK